MFYVNVSDSPTDASYVLKLKKKEQYRQRYREIFDNCRKATQRRTEKGSVLKTETQRVHNYTLLDK